MTERQNVKVNFFNQNIFGSVVDPKKYSDDSIAELIGWLTEKLKEVPSEYRETAKVEIDSVGGYEGEHHSEINLYYTRPETDAEMELRISRTKAALEQDLQRHEAYAAQARAALSRS